MATVKEKKESPAFDCLAVTSVQVFPFKDNGLTSLKGFANVVLNDQLLLRFDQSLAFNITLGILADHLLPLLTEEEKEALRNESTNVRK